MKRANGTGSISNLGPGRRKPYAVKESYRDDDGILHQRVLGTFRTRSEAQQWLECYNADKLRGLAPPPGALSVTIGQLWDAWSARELADAGASKRKNYTAPWDRRLSKYSARKIREMRTDDWQEIIDADVRAGLSSGSVDKLKVLMGALSRYALERDYIVKDYVQFVRMPKKQAVMEKGILTMDHLQHLTQLAAAGDPWADTVIILCYTGFRAQEFLNLTPESYRPEEGGYFIGGMKTDAGRDRTVPIHPAIAGYVQARLAQGGERIICSAKGKAVPYGTYIDRFAALAEKIGQPKATPHWCRHTFTTMATEAHVDEVARKIILGHSMEKDITQHYTHAGVKFLVEEIVKIPSP